MSVGIRDSGGDVQGETVNACCLGFVDIIVSVSRGTAGTVSNDEVCENGFCLGLQSASHNHSGNGQAVSEKHQAGFREKRFQK